MNQHTSEAIGVVSGLGATWGSGIVAFSIAVTPVLHAIAVLVTIIVGILTGWWTWKKTRMMDIKATAVVAASAVEARAVVVATALEESKDG